MEAGEPRGEQVEREGHQAQPDRQREGGPAEEERRRTVVVAAVGQRPPVPLVPLMAEPTVHIDVDQLRTRRVRHTGTR